MSAQDDQDWLDLLAGKSVPDADSNTVHEAQIFRAALLAQAQREKMDKAEISSSPILAKVLQRLETEGYLQQPKTPEISKPKTTFFQQYDPLWSLAASLLIAVLIIVTHIPEPIITIPEQTSKGPIPCVNKLFELQPLWHVIQLQQELKTLGIVSEINRLTNGFRLKAILPTDKSPALLKLLARYDNPKLLLKNQYLCVNFLAKEAQ